MPAIRCALFRVFLLFASLSAIFAPGRQALAQPRNIDSLIKSAQKKYGNIRPEMWSENIPGVTDKLPVGVAGGTPLVALTLDACGGKAGESYDAEIIAYLRQESIPATIFVTNKWIGANTPALLDLANDPLFEIAAHGAAHKPCSVNGKGIYGIPGTASIKELIHEVEDNAAAIEKLTGKRPLWFRSGTAYYDEIAAEIILFCGYNIAGFTIPADRGATLPADEVGANVASAQAGAIVLCHMNRPLSGTREGLKTGLAALKASGVRFVTLSQAWELAENRDGASKAEPETP